MAYLDPIAAGAPPNDNAPDLAETDAGDPRRLGASGARPCCGVLLLHGLVGGVQEMAFLAAALGRQGFVIRTPTLEPDALGAKRGWRRRLARARSAFTELATETDQVFIVGHGAGAGLAIALADGPEAVAGLALLSITQRLDGWNMPRWLGWPGATWILGRLPGVRDLELGLTYPYGLKDLRARAASEGGGASTDRTTWRALADLQDLGRQVERCAPSVRAPALVLHALEDDVSDPRNARRIGACLAGAVEFAWLEDSYHRIARDRRQAEVAERIGSYFVALARAYARTGQRA